MLGIHALNKLTGFFFYSHGLGKAIKYQQVDLILSST
jgi:hypothetical protein